ncbi:MAG: HD domain-containing phosphohydrolase [Candidatus Kryptoniota bacterium]
MSKFVENRKVLYIDDEDGPCTAFKYFMGDRNVEVYTLNNSAMIEDFLKSNGPFAVVLSDQRMPVKDGIEVLHEVMKTSPDTMRVLVTGYDDMETVKGAINEGGIVQYISKPWNDEKVCSLIDDLLMRYNTTLEKRFLLSELKLKNEILQLTVKGTTSGVLKLLNDLIAALGKDVASQNDRIRRLGQAVLKLMPELSEKENWEISCALELFNLGLVLLPTFIQLKVIKEGMSAIKDIQLAHNHHLIAAEMLRGIPKFEGVADIIMLMRKDFSGIGEPHSNKTKGKELPLGSRILRILLDLENHGIDRVHGHEALKSMMKQNSIYDTELIERMLGTESLGQEKGGDAGAPVRVIDVRAVSAKDSMRQNGHGSR